MKPTIEQLEAWLEEQRRTSYRKVRQHENSSQDEAMVHMCEGDAFAEALHYLRTGERRYLAGSDEGEEVE